MFWKAIYILSSFVKLNMFNFNLPRHCGTHHPKLQLDVTPYLLSGFPKPTFQHLELTPVGSELPLVEV